MIGSLLRLGRLGLLAAGGAIVADRLLARVAVDRPTEPIRSLVVIDAPIERVWDVLADVEHQPDWMDDLLSVRLVTPPPIGVGTRAEGTVRIMGITVADPITITEFDPPHRFAIRHEGAYTGSSVITLAPNVDGTGTVVTWDETLVAPVLPHLADRLGRPIFRAVFQRDLHNLRSRVEA